MLEWKGRVNGLPVCAGFREESVERVFLPLLWEIARRPREEGRRTVAFLAGPPGAGKSTLAAFLEELSRETPGLPPLQALGMDGFHYPQEEIARRRVLRAGRWQPMRRYKGGPESFDTEKLARALETLGRGDPVRWPVYDRRLHDVVEEALEVRERLALVEGNWMLDLREPWAGLYAFCDLSIALRGEEALLRPRLVARKVAGGLSQEDAQAFYEDCDGPNVRMCLENMRKADVELLLPL